MNQSIQKFKQGNQYVDIVTAVTKNELTPIVNEITSNSEFTKAKFVPASGAATRMFKDLYAYLEERENNDFIDKFFNHLEEFAFYDFLKNHIDFEQIDKNNVEDRVTIIQKLLDFRDLPKALIEFHQYENHSTTPIDEQLYEAEKYLNADEVNIHFTISEEHEDLFNQHIEKATEGKDNINITYSFQKKHTNTLAVDLENEPFYLENGDVLYRPGGHGSLLANLDDLEEDIIFIKNIDNVVHQSQIEDTIESKKVLAAIGIGVKEQIDAHIKNLLADDYDLTEVQTFINETLNITLKEEMTKEKALEFLNRPLRVAGVVKNEGEPGGGPYVVDNGDYSDLQICEKSEINLDDEKQTAIFNESEYFNPVDIVCFTKDYKGNKFNLLNYANEDRYFISDKTYEGRPLKALEHPGLWNGAMHNWNTIFVEVPLSTFNPVKTVNDLLKDGHKSV